MRDTFTLEFNVKQQMFHHNYGQHPGASHGWFTIDKNVSDLDFHAFEAFISFYERQDAKPFTRGEIKKCWDEFNWFKKRLSQYNIGLSDIKTMQL